MKSQPSVEYALMCLVALDEEASGVLSMKEISRRQGIPLRECQEILRRFSQAGLISRDEEDAYRLTHPLEDLTALEVMQAVATPAPVAPAFHMWVGTRRKAIVQMTLEAVSRARQTNRFPSENGVGDEA